MSETTRPKQECPDCRKMLAVKKDGAPYAHACVPACVSAEQAHVFTWNSQANESQCAGCGEPDTGDLKAARFAEATPLPYPGSPSSITDPAQYEPEVPADPWDDPTSFADAEPTGPLKRKRTDQRTGHRVKDPRTGDFRRWKNGNVRGFTRVTTFVKAASDRTALTDWNERNVIIGAAKKPDIALRALSEDSESKEGKQALNALVDLVKEAAGAKDAANFGTDVHNSVERVVTGKCTVASLPETHRGWVQAYVDALEEHGLRVVPGLVERSVFCPEFGGVVGSFDQVVEEISTGKHFIADVKTGARMDYAWQEIEAQLALYVCGYSMHGTYVWSTMESEMDTEGWEPPTVTLDAAEGIVFHLPARGGGEPHCNVLRADLKRGWEHAKLCATVRKAATGRPKPEAWTGSTPETPTAFLSWEELFSMATSREGLSELYTEAANVVPRMELDRLVRIGQQRLREIGA